MTRSRASCHAESWNCAVSVDPNVVQLLPLSDTESAAALQKGDIDGALMVAAWDTAAVRVSATWRPTDHRSASL